MDTERLLNEGDFIVSYRLNGRVSKRLISLSNTPLRKVLWLVNESMRELIKEIERDQRNGIK